MSDAVSPYDVLSDGDMAAFRARQKWLLRARSGRRGGKQIPPVDGDWEMTLFLAGRGWGKSLAQCQWGWWEAWRVPGIIGHAIAPTYSDARGTIFSGPAGFRSMIPAECLRGGSWERAYTGGPPLELWLSNGSLIRGFGAVEEAARLRGPQCHFIVGDELREWDKPAGNLELALNNALFGLRLPYPDGTPARAVLATTSKPIPFLKRLQKRPGVRVVRGTSYENISNLSPTFRSTLLALEGTALGRQEIHGAFLDEETDTSIIKRSWIKLWPAHKPLPVFHFIAEVYDTAASEENFDKKRQETDPTACIVLGVFNVNDAFDEKTRKKLGIRCRYAALLCDAWSERMGLPELLERARKQNRIRWGAGGRPGSDLPGRRSDIVLIEDKSSGPGLRQFLHKFGVPAWPTNPGRLDKTMRLHGVSPLLYQGMLFVPESMRPDRESMPRDWVEPFLEQVCAFAGPGTTEHDDFVDVLSGGFTYLRDRNILEATPEERLIDREEQRDMEEQKALKELDNQKRRDRTNPYG
jgi:predicted phage terminase large subunit-like protein